MQLSLILTRKARDPDQPVNEKGRIFLDTGNRSGLVEQLQQDMPYPQFPKEEIQFMADQLLRQDGNLGNGDLFEAHQIEPLAAVMYATGITQITSPQEMYDFCGRMELWDKIPVERKLFEIFGKATKMRICQNIAKLMEKSWQFRVEDLDKNDSASLAEVCMPNISEQDFNLIVYNKTRGIPV